MAIFALAAILIAIALINVFNTSLLAMQEKTRDFGILKTVGMTPAQVMAMVNTSAGCLGFVAALVGVPLGFAITRSLLASLSQTYGFGKVHVALHLGYVGLLIPLAVLVSLAGSIVPARQAARLPIVSVLRHG
jgi:putative ABC transport system permease protein